MKKERETQDIFYHRLLDEINDSIIIHQDGKIVFANARFAELIGWSLEDIVGQPITVILPPDRVEEVMRKYRERIGGGQVQAQYEIELLRRDGIRVPVEFSVRLVEYEGRPAALAVIRDITERKRLEELQYSLILENTGVGMYIVQDGKLQYVNSLFKQQTGYSDKELIGTNSLSIVHPEDREMVRKKAIESLKDDSKAPYEYRCVRKDGEVIWILERVTSIQYQGKRAAMGSFMDITERKQALEKIVEASKQERKLREELQEEMNRRINFTHTMVHEIKTPLTPLLITSDLLAAELKEEPWLGLAKNINRSIHNLNRRTDELLDLAKGEVGILSLKYRLVEPAQLLQEVADEVSAMVTSKRQSLILELPSSLQALRADEERLRQIMLNLLNNAHKFTPEKGKITVKAEDADDALIVEIQNTGPGVSDHDKQLLFQPYQRISKGSGEAPGLGLGLTLSKMLVELHGGKMWVKSKKGQGSTFGFSIPRSIKRGQK